MQEGLVWFLVGELRSCMLSSTDKKISKHFELGKVLNKMLVIHNNVFLEIKIYNKGKWNSCLDSHVQMWELDHIERWAPKNWCFWTVVLEKTLENPLDCREIQPVHPKGNHFLIFIGRTDAEAEIPILQPPVAKSWLICKDPDAEKDWRWEEKGTTKDEMVECHHQLNGHEFE